VYSRRVERHDQVFVGSAPQCLSRSGRPVGRTLDDVVEVLLEVQVEVLRWLVRFPPVVGQQLSLHFWRMPNDRGGTYLENMVT